MVRLGAVGAQPLGGLVRVSRDPGRELDDLPHELGLAPLAVEQRLRHRCRQERLGVEHPELLLGPEAERAARAEGVGDHRGSVGVPPRIALDTRRARAHGRWVVAARITVGRYTLSLGGPHGTVAEPAEHAEQQSQAALAGALSAAPPAQPSGAAEVASSIEDVNQTTSAVEDATHLAEALARGLTLDPQTLQTQLNGLIDLAEKADGEGRYKDEIRLSRALVTLLSLGSRWLALIEMLRRAGSAAAATGDPASSAWAHHELGTFSLAGGDRNAAVAHLDEARQLRESFGDFEGAEVSRRNLELARAAEHTGFGRRALVIGGI